MENLSIGKVDARWIREKSISEINVAKKTNGV